MTSNIFTKLKHVGLCGYNKRVNFHKVQCLILTNKVLQGKSSAMLLLVNYFSEKELRL